MGTYALNQLRSLGAVGFILISTVFSTQPGFKFCWRVDRQPQRHWCLQLRKLQQCRQCIWRALKWRVSAPGYLVLQKLMRGQMSKHMRFWVIMIVSTVLGQADLLHLTAMTWKYGATGSGNRWVRAKVRRSCGSETMAICNLPWRWRVPPTTSTWNIGGRCYCYRVCKLHT